MKIIIPAWNRLTLVILLGLISRVQAQPQLDWKERRDLNVLLPPSVRVYDTYDTLPGGKPIRAMYARINLSDRNLRLRAVGEERGSGFSLRTTREYAELNRAILAVNGGFFSSNASVSLITTDGEGVAPNAKAVAQAGRTYYPTRGAFGLINRKPDVAWVYGLGGSVEGGDNTTYQYPVPSPVNAANPPPPPPTP
ncbi:MAG: hypothetical protein H7Z75_08920, partial [Ferruginibacter sp.]|nr:hypothetical protein [Cytophagales bacterium]